MTKPVPQRERLLEMVKVAPGRSVHTFELRQALIGNPSRERLHGSAVGTRYKLVSEPVPAPAPPPLEGTDPSTGQLFHIPSRTPDFDEMVA